MERHSSDLMELSTRQNFATWLPHAGALRGWARSACGDTVEGMSWIEDGLKDTRTTGVMLTVPFLLALKSEALHLAGRTAEALEAIREGTHSCKDLKTAIGLPNYTGSAVCFSRLWVLRRPKLRLRFVKPSARQAAKWFTRDACGSNLRAIPPSKGTAEPRLDRLSY